MKIQALIPFIQTKYANLPSKQKPIALILAAGIGLIAIMLLFKGCIAIASGKKNLPAEPLLIRQGKAIIIPQNSALRSQMLIKTIKSSTAPHMVSVPGIIEANPSQTVNILPPLTGRLIGLKVKLGDTVKRNQVLAVIRSPDLAQAYSDQDKALSALKLSNDALKRARGVNLAGANAIKDIEFAQNNYTQALAELKRTQATLKALSHKGFSLLNIKSPQEGQITALNYGKGSYINDLNTPLLTISNTTSVWITANIPENMIGSVSKGLPVEIFLHAYPEKILHGTILFVSAYLDPDTRRNNTRIALPNPDGKLQLNMFATVKIAIPQPSQVFIPVSSILMNNDTTSVYVEVKPWTFERRDVELGTEDKENIRVLAGLREGERIVTAGGVFVND